MANLDALKQKYAPVIATLEEFSEYGATFESAELDGEKLHLKGTVPSDVIANRVWDSIKACDPTYSDLEHEIATTGGAEQSYTIKSGDNLSKVSKLFYGNANKYLKIAEANGMDNPDLIKPGQVINIPVLT